MTGTIVQVSISNGGLPKYAVSHGLILPLGIEGDRHAHPEFHGGPNQAILLVSAENVEALRGHGYPLFFGALGENLTTRGLDFRTLRMGDQIRAGAALLEITKPRGPCSQLDVYGQSLRQEVYDERVHQRDPASPRWGMSGFYAAVRTAGEVRPGDIIEVVATLA
jgi:MOSC domain-containing protein YiiM